MPQYDSSRRKVKQAKDPNGEQVRVLQDALRHMNVAATWKVKGISPRQSFQWWIAVLNSFSCPWEFAAGFAGSISSQVCIPKVWMTFIDLEPFQSAFCTKSMHAQMRNTDQLPAILCLSFMIMPRYSGDYTSWRSLRAGLWTKDRNDDQWTNHSAPLRHSFLIFCVLLSDRLIHSGCICYKLGFFSFLLLLVLKLQAGINP